MREAYVVSLVYIQICVHVSLVCTPHCASHAWPWFPECENTFHIITWDFFAGNGIDDDGVDAEERKGRAAGLCWRNTSERCDDMRASLSLPVSLFMLLAILILSADLRVTHINDMRFLLSDDLEVPLPDFCRNWLTD